MRLMGPCRDILAEVHCFRDLVVEYLNEGERVVSNSVAVRAWEDLTNGVCVQNAPLQWDHGVELPVVSLW